MTLLKRLRNLWLLSRFEITKFDNKLVITKQEEELFFARPKEPEPSKMAQIIRINRDPVKEILNEN